MLKNLFNIKKQSYVQAKPEEALNWSYQETIQKLSLLLDKKQLSQSFDISKYYPSPVCTKSDSSWLKKTKIIGINPRIAKTYWGIVKYAMTFPEQGIHIMPLWTPGCDEGIYARLNWKLSKQWLDPDLIKMGFDTPGKQLKLVVNILHSLGKVVGFDCAAHTDKFSEEVFIYPEYFEWIKLNCQRTKQILPPKVDNAKIHKDIETLILGYLRARGNAKNERIDEDILRGFFSSDVSYELRSEILFGENEDTALRRRMELLQLVRSRGFETVPVVEHAPSRPIDFEKIAKNKTTDWAEFTVENKKKEAGIFNSITPYRWYEVDAERYIDPSKPVLEVLQNFLDKTAFFQSEYNFDFLRADMAHIQISHAHNGEEKELFYEHEMWKLVKENIQKNTPYFATFAEAFFNEYYIDGIQDMKNKAFDIILGVSCFKFLNQEFIDCIKHYKQIAGEHCFSPCVSAMTGDSDKPENKDYHKSPLANEIRYFTMLFLDLPGYAGMGIESRELEPKLLCEFSSVFTIGQPYEYKWGNNDVLFAAISQMRAIYDKIYNDLLEGESVWLNLEDQGSFGWVILNKKSEPRFLFVINLDNSTEYKDIVINAPEIFNFERYRLKPIYSLLQEEKYLPGLKEAVISDVLLGDARIYEFKI